MNKKVKNIYDEAIKFYNEGRIDKTIDACEKGLAIESTNGALLNLKGLILYIKGELKEAKRIWEINFKINRDSVAEKYIESTREDADRLKAYFNAEELYRNMKIKDSLTILLDQCNKSDFNGIKVKNLIGKCYMALGKYDLAEAYYKLALNMDKVNEDTKKNIREMKSITKAPVALGKIAIIMFIILLGTGIIYKFYKGNNGNLVIENTQQKTTEEENKVIDPVEKEKIKEENQGNLLDRNLLQKSIESKDYEKIYEVVGTIDKNTELSLNDKSLFNRGIETLSSNGVEFFYEKAMEALKKENRKEAEKYFEIAFTYGENSYLYPHIIYEIAFNSENQGNIEKAISFYKLYVEKFKNSDYGDLSLYKLAMMYKDIDKNKSKEYAKAINREFPHSMYNNINIKNIIKGEN